MKIILIDPPGFAKGGSIGLAYLAAIAKKNGFNDIRVVDFQNYRQNINERMKKIIEDSPDIVGVTVNSFTIINALDIIGQLKNKLQKTKFIAGGPGVTSSPKIFLQRTKDLFDISVFGEGEITFLELLNYFDKNKPANLSQIAGLAYWKDKEIIINQKRKLNFDLDSLSLPNYDVFDSVKTGLIGKNYQILTSRGCPNRCVFCMNLILNQAVWRGRSPENVIEELVLAKKKYNIKSFTVRDDNFTQDMNRAERICEKLIELNFNIPWKCKAAVRADRVRSTLLRKMKQAGCGSLTMGIESGDREIFPLVKKGESLDTIVAGVNMIKKAGIKVDATMVIGLINDSYKSVLKSIKFLKEINMKAHWYLALPFRGTPLFDWATKNSHFLIDCDFIDAYHHTQSRELVVPFETKDFTVQERCKAYYKANISSENFEFIWIDGVVQSDRYKHLSRPQRVFILLGKVLRYHPFYFFKAVRYLVKIATARYRKNK